MSSGRVFVWLSKEQMERIKETFVKRVEDVSVIAETRKDLKIVDAMEEGLKELAEREEAEKDGE